MSFFVYILRCSDGSYYIGHTDDLDQRLDAHAGGGGSAYTALRRPVELVWSDTFSTREEALTHERQLKGWSRRKKEALVRGDWKEIQRLSRGKAV